MIILTLFLSLTVRASLLLIFLSISTFSFQVSSHLNEELLHTCTYLLKFEIFKANLEGIFTDTMVTNGLKIVM